MYTGSRVRYEKSHFKESKQKGWFGNGEIQFSFYTLNNTLQATAAYVICSNGDIAPQYIAKRDVYAR